MNLDDCTRDIRLLQLDVAVIRAKLDLLTSLILDTFGSTLPKEQQENLYTNYVNEFETRLNAVFDDLSEVIGQTNRMFLNEKFAGFQAIRRMKEDERYIHT